MPNNKITIGVGKQENNDKTQRISKDDLYNSPLVPVETEPVQEQAPPEENVWGNDYILDKVLDKEYLDEKRRYVRVRYLQKLSCPTLSESVDSEPVTLIKPITLTMSDVSMGGIGAVCSHELNLGTILDFDIVLDHLKYNIGCEVVYCIVMEESFRIGLRIVRKSKEFVRHLKILVARISLHSQYGHQQPKKQE